ncbi:MAG: hypothetical protein IPG71_13625 [bacterium]|nr:hypothetical protein [bacterium]
MRALLILLVVAAIANAIPQQINYQGHLTNPGGASLDTTVSMQFRLFEDSLGGVQLWSESWPAVTSVHGLFNVRLGQLNPLTDPPLLNATELWLGVTVGNNSQMTPLTRVVSVPFSLRTRTVQGALGGTITSDLTVTGFGQFGTNNSVDDATCFAAGEHNNVFARHSAIVSGRDNSANDSLSFIGGGYSNTTFARNGVIGGGGNNRVRGAFSVIAGGGGATAADSNSAVGAASAIGGGSRNVITQANSTIGGGFGNSVSGIDGTVGGGALNAAAGVGSVVSGGIYGKARGDFSFVGGGGGFLPVDSNFARGSYSVLAGGRSNTAGTSSTDSGAVVCGGYANAVYERFGVISGGAINLVEGEFGTIGGGTANVVHSRHGVVTGGESNENYGQYGVIGGGFNHLLSDSATYSFIGGGEDNQSGDDHSAVVGGELNVIGLTAHHSSIGGGFENSIDGLYSTIPGGANNTCEGDYAFAAGLNGNADHNGSFVWSDATGLPAVTSSANNQFTARASGGVRMFTNNAMTSGLSISGGGNAWVVVSDSTKKRDIHMTNTAAILEKVAALPIKALEYDSEAQGTEHIGPMAQDFWNAFQLGSDSLGIETIDADGVLFAAVQELALQNIQKGLRIAELDTRIKRLEAIILQIGNANRENHQ